MKTNSKRLSYKFKDITKAWQIITVKQQLFQEFLRVQIRDLLLIKILK